MLALVRRGLTNEEIASRLGISFDTAKFHVSQILSKLGASSREEAAALAAPETNRWRHGVSQVTLAAKLALGAASIALLIGLGVLAWSMLASDDNDPSRVTVVGPCNAADLVVHSEGGGAATGHYVASYSARNNSANPCQVHGAPTLQLLSPGGAVIAIGAPCGSWATQGDCANAVTVLEPRDTTAIFTVSWHAVQLTGTNCEEEVASAAIDLPEGGGLVALPGEASTCDVPEGASQFVAVTTTPAP